MQVDYIIVGQGITGTFLSYNLIKAGKKVLVIDDNRTDSPSRVASGIINPVTGRRIVRTWMIETLLPYAQQAYEEIGNELSTSVAKEIEILTFHTTDQMVSAWEDRIDEGEEFINTSENSEEYRKLFRFNKSIGITSPCLLVHLEVLLPAWRKRLLEQNALLEESFDLSACEITDNGVKYKDIQADKLILCNGTSGYDNEYFKRLPFAQSKGEAIMLRIPDLPQTHIYKQGLNLVPMGGDEFWVGSSFEWKFEHEQPTEGFKQKVIGLLNDWLQLPYEILSHRAAIRPTSLERRPFVGLHPKQQNIGIFNGMGTKGCSLAPYFAEQFTNHLLNGAPIDKDASVDRFEKILLR